MAARRARTDQSPVPWTIFRVDGTQGSRSSLLHGRRRMASRRPCFCGDRTMRRGSRLSNWHADLICWTNPSSFSIPAPRTLCWCGGSRGRYRRHSVQAARSETTRFSCPNSFHISSCRTRWWVTNDLPYVKSVVQAGRCRPRVRLFRPIKLCRHRQSDCRLPGAPRPLSAERAEVRQAIVQLAMSRRGPGRAVSGHVARDRRAARVFLRSSNPLQSLRSKSFDRPRRS